jgi:hypothetical protein
METARKFVFCPRLYGDMQWAIRVKNVNFCGEVDHMRA